MSVNLTVPTVDSPNPPNMMGKPKVIKRAKSPAAASNTAKNANRNSGISVGNVRNARAKSKSPNPSFCSVLSRVKDWELGAFTPKTALADNLDKNGSDITNSDVSNNLMCPSNEPDGRSATTPWRNDGSPEPPRVNQANAELSESKGGKLLKSALNSDIGENDYYSSKLD